MLKAILRKGIVFFGLSLAAVALLWSPAWATMAPIFGPKQFIRSTGAPQEFTETFRNCETAAQYKLVVVNGTPEGTNRVSSGSVILNGTQIIGPSDFNQQVGRIERPVSVALDNALQVRLASKPGSFLTVSVECTANCLDVQITSPGPNSTVASSKPVVVGTVTSSADEVGVVVNAIVAAVQDPLFAAPGVPLQLGSNALTATATNACLNSAQTSILVNTPSLQDPPIEVRASPFQGLAPLDVTVLVALALANPVQNIEWDFDGDGVVDASGPTLTTVLHTYAQPGLYLLQARVTDSKGSQFSATIPINVLSRDALQGLLQKRWDQFKAGMAGQSVDASLELLHPTVRDKYGPILLRLQPSLPQISTTVGAVSLFSVFGIIAEVVTVRQHADGAFAYLIYYSQDAAGLWKIISM